MATRRAARPDVIWVEITAAFCGTGLNRYWVYPAADRYVPAPANCPYASMQRTREWFALRTESHPEAYEWRWDARPTRSGGGVQLLRPTVGWSLVLDYPPCGVTIDMANTHPYVTFHYER